MVGAFDKEVGCRCGLRAACGESGSWVVQEQGQEPGQEPGKEQGQEQGQEPGQEQGQEQGQEPGQEPGQEQGQEPGQGAATWGAGSSDRFECDNQQSDSM